MLAVSLLVVLGIATLTSGNDDGERIATDAGILARAGMTTVVEAAAAVVEPTTTTSSTVAPVPAPPTTRRGPVTTTTRVPTAVLSAAVSATTTTAVPATTITAAPATTITAPATTTTTAAPAPIGTVAPAPISPVDPCRNSTDSACGPFRFDPQPGADNPMTVEVTVEPATPVAGQPMVFRITLTDPDGVSYDATNFNFGNSGIGGSTPEACTKFGPWDPPARDPATATQTVNVSHTYFEAGTYTATFFFDAGPFDCVDSVTGRGDRPYASSATGTVTVVVGA